MKESFRQLFILYGALAGGQILFAAVVMALISQSPETGTDQDNIFMTILPFFVLSCIFAAFGINRMRKSKAAEVAPEGRFDYYRSLLIIRCALVEGASLFSIVVALITSDMRYLLFFAACLIAFMVLRPGVDEYLRLFSFSPQEEAKIRQELSN